ncbi:flavoprotein NADH-dependent oxidoreductase [Formosa agariphila KMM 3901]|uniref:Flavoprotein NADH-dependent oxidoreductase n=1 Tax=Formosa agariphila (strain DSM 15362 / KCTC 12365 / LMG 23005 / KMM 3901 / M-2Alg 35-1) TaxID=1347342 RepID=T2KLG3_FORAG|nr:alkene reductase [Formosa agariphila]CDF79276.1 flavoprotein NADH-dependent oxidoreductase [Formosa agariphila KMM 3901]
MSKQHLLTPYNKNIKLNNRIVMAPMTRSRADNEGKEPTDELHALYYEQRASAGLIITEGSQVSREATGYINTPGIYTEAQVEGWKKVTKRVHDKGGTIFIQLWHVGRISHPDFHDGDLPVSASAINPEAKSFTPEGFKDTVTPKAMTVAEIKRTVKDFQNAAINAVEAGFDGVEIHSSNGYLFQQFFNNCSNTRTDDYGGSKENNSRFFFEVLDAIKEVIPQEKIGARFNPSLHGMSGITVDEETIPTFEYIIKRLNDYNLAYVHLSEPFTDVSDVPFAVTEVAKHFRPLYNGTLMINNGFDKAQGNNVIEAGDADLVAYGKLYISNPDLVERFENDLDLAEWDKDTFYTTGEKGYTDYPKASQS